MMHALVRPALLVAALLGLASCSAISSLSDASTPLEAYELTAPGMTARAQRTARDLVVEVPSSNGGLATDRIMVRPHPLQAQYLPGARWTEETPQLVQTLLIRSIENTSALRYVGRTRLAGAADYALALNLTDFQAETDNGGAVIRTRATARLIADPDGRVIATRTFTASANVENLETLALVEGFNAATQEMLSEMTTWTLRSIGLR
jgi:cholesterol transport system auxiliary component